MDVIIWHIIVMNYLADYCSLLIVISIDDINGLLLTTLIYLDYYTYNDYTLIIWYYDWVDELLMIILFIMMKNGVLLNWFIWWW